MKKRSSSLACIGVRNFTAPRTIVLQNGQMPDLCEVPNAPHFTHIQRCPQGLRQTWLKFVQHTQHVCPCSGGRLPWTSSVICSPPCQLYCQSDFFSFIWFPCSVTSLGVATNRRIVESNLPFSSSFSSYSMKASKIWCLVLRATSISLTCCCSPLLQPWSVSPLTSCAHSQCSFRHISNIVPAPKSHPSKNTD